MQLVKHVPISSQATHRHRLNYQLELDQRVYGSKTKGDHGRKQRRMVLNKIISFEQRAQRWKLKVETTVEKKKWKHRDVLI